MSDLVACMNCKRKWQQVNDYELCPWCEIKRLTAALAEERRFIHAHNWRRPKAAKPEKEKV